jgi:hypothetical protein
LKERPHRLDVLPGARHQPEQDLASVLADAPGGQNRLTPLARPQPLGDAVDEQIDDGVLGEIALAEILVFDPQPLGDLAHRRPRQKPLARLVGEGVLDVARRQAPRVKLDRQTLEFPRAPRKRRPDARDERLGRVANLRRRIVHRPLRRLHLAGPIPVAVAGLLALAALVALAPERVADLALKRLPPRSDVAPGGQDRRAPPPSPNLRSSRREAPRACARGRITSASGCSLEASGANRKPVPIAIQAGCIPTPFPANLRLHPRKVWPS